MKVMVKVKFGCSLERFEKFGDGKYVAYLPYPEEDDSHLLIGSLIAKSLGLPGDRVEFAGVDGRGFWVFEV